MITPEQIAKDSESSQQTALFCHFAIEMRAGRYLECRWLFHIPNGGARGDDERSRMIAGGKMKAEGVKPGVADLSLPVARRGYYGLYIEMKKPAEKRKDNPRAGCSDKQNEFLDFAIKEGYAVGVCYSWIEAKELTLMQAGLCIIYQLMQMVG
jgi:hypothetical protein